MPFIKFFKLKPSFCHRVTHPTAHRWEPCEICGIVKVLSSQDVRHDEVVWEAGEGSVRLGKARGSSVGRDITARVRLKPEERHHSMTCACRCAGFFSGVTRNFKALNLILTTMTRRRALRHKTKRASRFESVSCIVRCVGSMSSIGSMIMTEYPYIES